MTLDTRHASREGKLPVAICTIFLKSRGNWERFLLSLDGPGLYLPAFAANLF